MTSPAASRYHRLTVQAVVQETADSHSLLFHIPPELEAAFRYKPGQFLTLRPPCTRLMVTRGASSTPGALDME